MITGGDSCNVIVIGIPEQERRQVRNVIIIMVSTCVFMLVTFCLGSQ